VVWAVEGRKRMVVKMRDWRICIMEGSQRVR